MYIDVGIITSIPHSPRLLSIGIWCWMTIIERVMFLMWPSAPSQVGKSLGFISDLVEVKFQVPGEKLTNLYLGLKVLQPVPWLVLLVRLFPRP